MEETSSNSSHSGFSYVDAQKTQIIYSFLEYVEDLKKEGNMTEEKLESLEVATQCLCEAFGIDLSDEEKRKRYTIKPHSLPTVMGMGLAGKEKISHALEQLNKQRHGDDIEIKFGQYIQSIKKKGFFQGVIPGSTEYEQRYSKARQKFFSNLQKLNDQSQQQTSQPKEAETSTKAEQTTPVQNSSTTSSTSSKTMSKEEKEKLANDYKLEGNKFLSQNQFSAAISSYTKAIELDPNNAIFYSNRAAALSHMGRHEEAVEDCKISIEKNPNYSKAYARLGLANFSLGNYQEAVDAYKKALELEPNSETLKESLAAAQNKLPQATRTPSGSQVPPGGPGNLPPGGMGGGLGNLPPEFSNLLNNPDIQNMASQFMSNPAMMNMAQNLMSNPEALNNLMGAFGNNFGRDQGEER